MARAFADCAAVVLAGGQGTRLQTVLPDRQKVVAPVGGRPFLAWVLDRLDAAGVEVAVLCTGHLAGQVRAALGSRHGRVGLRYSVEPTPLGTFCESTHVLCCRSSNVVQLHAASAAIAR